MSWPQWPGGGVPQPGVVQTPIINPAPNVVNPAAPLMPTSQYTPEQWAQMQQQNWQQWAQWQQQFQQWQQQYGAEYQKSISAMAQTRATPVQPPVPFFNNAPPPLPVETKPPPPPDDPQVEQFQQPSPVPFPTFSSAPPPIPQSTYSNTPQPPQPAPPKETFQNKFNRNQSNAPPNQGGFQNRNRNEGFNNDQQRFSGNQNYSNNRGPNRNPNWQNQNNRNQPNFGDDRFNQPANEMNNRGEYGLKRPYQSHDVGDPKRNKMDPNIENTRWKGPHQQKQRWGEAPPNQSENQQQWDTKPTDSPAKSNPEELTEAEKKFDKQFADWESQFQKWKEQNANHPDKEQYREYEKKWETWRAQLLDRREQMRRKRLGLTDESPQPASDKPQSKPEGDQEKVLDNKRNSSETGDKKSPEKTGLPQIGPQIFPINTAGKPGLLGSAPHMANVGTPSPNIGKPSILGTPPNLNTPPPNFGRPPPNLNNQPLDFKKGASEAGEKLQLQQELSSNLDDTAPDFLKSSSSGGIPGLDLVKDGKDDEDKNEEHSKAQKDSENQKPDLEAISRGINSILGDQKLMNMLSLVSQNQSRPPPSIAVNTVSSIRQDSPKFSPEEYNQDDYDEYSNQDNGDFYEPKNQNVFLTDEQTRSSFNVCNKPEELDTFNQDYENSGRGSDYFDSQSNEFNPDFHQGPDRFGRGPNMEGGPNNWNSGPDHLRRGPNIDRGPDNFNQDPDNFNRGPNNFNRGPDDFSRGPDDFSRGPDNFNRGPDNFNRGPDNFNRGPDNFNRGPDNFNRGPDAFNRGPDNFNRGPDTFNRGSDNFKRGGPDNFNRGAESFNRDPDNFNRRPDNFNRGPDNFNRNFDDFDNSNKDPDNHNRRPDDFNRGPDNFNRGPDNSIRGPNNFSRGPGNFNRGPDNFNKGPDNFNEGVDHFNKGPDHFNKGPDHFNKGPDHFNKGPDNFNNEPDNFDNSQDNFSRRFDNFNRGNDDFNKGPDRFIRDSDNFNRDPGPNNRGGPDNFGRGPNWGPDNINRDLENVQRGPGFNTRGPNFNRDPDNFNRADEGPLSFNMRKEGSGQFEVETDRFGRAPDNFNSGSKISNNDESNAFGREQTDFNRIPPSFDKNDFNRRSDNQSGSRLESRFQPPDAEWSRSSFPNDLAPPHPAELTEIKDNKDMPDNGIWKPSKVIDYDHKTLKTTEPDVILEPVHTFDYRHKPLNRIPYPQRPKWLAEIVKNYPEFDSVISRPYETKQLRRYPERFDNYQKYEDRDRKPFDDRDRKPFDDRDRKPFDDRDRKPFDDRDRKPYDDRNRKPFDDRERKPFEDRERKPFDDRDRKPFEDRDRKPFDDRDRKPFEDRDRKPFDDRDRKPFDDRDRKPFDDRDRKPFDDRDRRPYDIRDRKSFDQRDRKPYEDRDRKSFDTKASDEGSRDVDDRKPNARDSDSRKSDNQYEGVGDSSLFKDKKQNREQQGRSDNQLFGTDKSETIKTVQNIIATKSNITLIEDLLSPPGRFNRPPRVVIILRGPPGSGKSFLAKLIKDKEVEHGGSAPRILCLDDYFMVEQEKEVEEDGRKVKVKEMVYEYEECMEAAYRQSLMKAFKKTITDGYFNFIIVDNINDKVKYFGEMWSFAKQNGFQVYICQMELDVQSCTKRNIHGRSEIEIERCVAGWETTPSHHPSLDSTSLIQSGSISEVEMEEINSPASETVNEEEHLITSKWDNFDYSNDNLAKLDGTNKPLRTSRTMEDYLQLDDEWIQPVSAKPGQKRVRWADLEERKEQEKMRAIGFVVGQTNWDRMMDPTMGSAALTQTKYIERYSKY